MKATSEKKGMYAIINNMIMEKLQNGKAPWRKTWNDFGPATNHYHHH